jgi:hypothetical protein
VQETLGVLLKYQDDVVKAKQQAHDLLARAQMSSAL